MEEFSQDHLDNLNQFSSVVWGNPGALTRRLSPDIEFLDLGRYFDSFQALFYGALEHPGKILVREEYFFALEALQTDPVYERGAYVSGQPGIGKTFFLFYALVQLLGQKQPVALHHLGGLPFYVLFNDTATIHALDRVRPLAQCGSVWALSDSNRLVESPPGSFTADPGRIRVIQATSPNASRWKRWSKESRASRYIMDIWTEKEIENLGVLLGLRPGLLIDLARKWGTVPRTLLQLRIQTDEQVVESYREDNETAVKECKNIVTNGRMLDVRGPSSFYFIRPRRLDSGYLSRMHVSVIIPTQTLCELLAEGLREQDNVIKLQFYRTLSQRAETRQAAGFIYESWFHSFVSAGKQIQCYWAAQGLDDMPPLPAILAGTTFLAPATLNALTTQTPPYYWLAPNSNFPGIDSALVLENAIFAFQVTIGATHISPIKGLLELRKRLPSNLKGLPWRLVFVGADIDQIKSVANSWVDKLFFPEGNCVPVGWSAVDPAENDVAFNVYRDRVEPVPGVSNEAMMEIEGEKRT